MSPAAVSNRHARMRSLIADPPIVRSWLVLIASVLFSAYVLVQLHAFNAGQIFSRAIAGGYCGWALYWGVPGCWTIARPVTRKWFAGCAAHGCGASLPTLLMLACVIVIYPLFGGGVFHFFRRWRTANATAQTH